MKTKIIHRKIIYIWVMVVCFALSSHAQQKDLRAEFWISTQSGSKKLTQEKEISCKEVDKRAGENIIYINDKEIFQTIDGMGSSLEPSTCYNLSQLDAGEREKTLRALLTNDAGIGMNLMRICMATPDFTGDAWYSYSDLPEGQSDTLLQQFSIAKDEAYIIPILLEALQVRPDLRFFASPWSPPAWMKTSNSLTGGRLKPEYYAAYARYFVKFIKAYETAGIPVFAVTVQNEPCVDREFDQPKWHYPSCHWTAEEQREFVKNHLGPELERNGLKTEIWVYDHNNNIKPITDNSQTFIPAKPGDAGISFPRTILSDSAARKYTSAMAFHGYVGTPPGMSVIQKEFPEVPVRFTEGSVFGLSGGMKLMEILKNQAISYNAWVIMLDQNRKPNNGPFEASRTIIERDTFTNKTVYNFDYYMYGHFMKFTTPGSKIIATAGKNTNISHLAFVNPHGQVILILINNSDSYKKTKAILGNCQVEFEMPGKSVVTLVYRKDH